MPKKKQPSKVSAKAKSRTAGMKAISETLDLGDGLSVTSMEAAALEIDTLIAAYNTMLAKLGEAANQIAAKEKALANLNERVLNAAAGKWGKDSDEYEKVGGIRKSERKKPVKKPRPAAVG